MLIIFPGAEINSFSKTLSLFIHFNCNKKFSIYICRGNDHAIIVAVSILITKNLRRPK